MTDKKTDWTHLAIALGGAIAGAAWAQGTVAEAKESEAERNHPEDVQDLCEEIGEILDAWEPDTKCDVEDDFTDDLDAYLESETEAEILVRPQTGEGCPDILIEDLLALELKVNPSKGELDRCIGQCAGYARFWVTWIVLIDVEPATLKRAEAVLRAQGLDHIAVWVFC